MNIGKTFSMMILTLKIEALILNYEKAEVYISWQT